MNKAIETTLSKEEIDTVRAMIIYMLTEPNIDEEFTYKMRNLEVKFDKLAHNFY